MGGSVRHIPRRTCVGCGQEKPKRELIRIVRTPDGAVEVDTTGKKSGRGTYLCASQSCWEQGLGKKRVDHGLRTSLSQECRQWLAQYAKGLAEGDEGSVG